MEFLNLDHCVLGPFHKSCLACFECSRQLDISSYYDGRDGGVYCKNCYGDKYGHKGKSRYANVTRSRYKVKNISQKTIRPENN